MEVYRISCRPFLFLGILCLAATLQAVQGGVESEGPSESECRPYIEKALRELETAETAEQKSAPDESEEQPSEEAEPSTAEVTIDDSDHERSDAGDDEAEGESREEDKESAEGGSAEVEDKSEETTDSKETEQEADATEEQRSEEDVKVDDDEIESAEEEEIVGEVKESEETEEGEQVDQTEEADKSDEETQEAEEVEDASAEAADEARQGETEEDAQDEDEQSSETDSTHDEDGKSEEGASEEVEAKSTEEESKEEEAVAVNEDEEDASQETVEVETIASQEETGAETDKESAEQDAASEEAEDESTEAPQDATDEASTESKEDEATEDEQPAVDDETSEATSGEDEHDREKRHVDAEEESVEEENKSQEEVIKDEEEEKSSKEEDEQEETASKEEGEQEEKASKEEDEQEEKASKEEAVETEEAHAIAESAESEEASDKEALEETAGHDDGDKTEEEADEGGEDDEEKETLPEEELINEGEIPDDLRPTDHIRQLLKLDDEHSQTEKIVNSIADITLRDLKRLYENAIKPLETLYKYRDLSNRHYGDAEIFSKPLVLFMGPWSGGKSSIINYLIENEYSETSLRTGAEPSPAYFNILMHGEEPEILDGTQLAADFTFSGLQKFGQGLEERLRGTKLPLKLLQKINIVEIPGILEVRKQISRVFPFNDACQWFIDRADIIYLIYDPSKLDVGPETEAILDQLKGREHQTRIILNKADQVKPEELMRVQGALIWNISPLMSSAQPPIMYTTSLWSRPYEIGAPVRLLQAQERAFLRDLRTAIDKRIETKIASARRFAVRVRNHAKMVDCYLTTYYNHKSVFGNRKQVSDAIIEHPQDYHIYEGLSTLTNISRYDLPDPDVYRDFFRLNPLYDFQQLSATCTYFRGCPINRLDVAIAYDLPELVGKHKRMVETALSEAGLSRTPGS